MHISNNILFSSLARTVLIPTEITSPVTAKAISAPSLSPEVTLLLILSEQLHSSLLVSLKQLADPILEMVT